MKYLPAVAASFAIGAAVIAGLIITKNPYCLAGLAVFYFADDLLPAKE